MLRDFIKSSSFWLHLIITSSLAAILIEIFCLSQGMNILFPYFFLIPMLIVIYAFPKRAVLFTVGMGWIYIVLVYVFGTFTVQVIAVHTAWFYTYVSLGIVITFFVERSRKEKEDVERLKKEAFQQIEHNLVQYEILNDQVRNALRAIVLYTNAFDGEAKEFISQQVQIIDKNLSTFEEKNAESKKARKFLRKHYDTEKK